MQQQQPYEVLSPWRLAVGIAFLVLALVLPLFSVYVAFLPLSAGVKAAIIAVLLLGAPEVCAIIAVFIMGKPAYNALKATVRDWTIAAQKTQTNNGQRKRLRGS
jgi:hypothetical protein